MKPKQRTTWKRWPMLAVSIGLLTMAGAAEADDRGRHDRAHGKERRARAHDARAAHRAPIREARRYDRRLDRQGQLIDGHLDLLAFAASASGEYDLAYALDHTGDRIEARLDRRGDRAVRRAHRQVRRHRADHLAWLESRAYAHGRHARRHRDWHDHRGHGHHVHRHHGWHSHRDHHKHRRHRHHRRCGH